MADAYEKSQDYPAGVVPFTRAVIPAANILFISNKPIGYVQRLDETQERAVDPQYEVGSIGPVELLPRQPAYNLTLEKVKIYSQNALQIAMDLGYSEKYGETTVKDAIKGQLVGDDTSKNREVLSLILHNILPFDLQVWELNYGVDASGNPLDFVLDPFSKSKVVTKYVSCWIKRYTKPITQGNANIIETMELGATKIRIL